MTKKNCSIVFTGDIGFDKHMDNKWEDENLLSPAVLDFFHSADHVCANVEGALIEAEDTFGKGVLFHSMNPQAAQVFQKMQADIWSLGNNHTMDAGLAGIENTKKIAGEMGVKTVGAGLNLDEASAPLYLDEAGGVGMICLSYLVGCVPATETEPGTFPWDYMELIAKRITEIKAKCRWCVVICHGGEEFASMPLPYVRDKYLKYLELGADVVVAHHPHVPENYELLDNGKAIFYSLGNFIFDTNYQRAHLYTENGILLKLIFTEEKMDFEAVGIEILRGREQIDVAPLPDIFTNIPADEYELLVPLSAKAFLAEDMRTMVYLEPEKYAGCNEAAWDKYYDNAISDYYCKDYHMDYDLILPLCQEAESGKWQQSRLEKVKEYMLRQLSHPTPIDYIYTGKRGRKQ